MSHQKSQTTIYIGDCRDVLKTLPDKSVHCVVTSPPYWGLRDYGTAEWEGGNVKCNHIAAIRGGPFKEVCGRCGARRIDSQIGLESEYQSYVRELVDVFREVKRVLRADGTVWLNLGDSYNAAGRTTHGTREGAKQGTHRASTARADKPRPNAYNLKSKDLVGIPWRVAFALQEDGWYLRQDIIWSKSNPMPESVIDRCTKSHEYIFLLSKSPKYYFDADAIAERALQPIGEYKQAGTQHKQIAIGRDVSKSTLAANQGASVRNKRSVWNVSTKPYHDAHFATFPPDLIQPCILAGTSANGCCEKCGAPWVREIEVHGGKSGKSWHNHEENLVRGQRGGASGHKGNDRKDYESYCRETTGWSPSCKCDAPQIPCTVLDPFGGTGTVAMVANNSGRDAIIIELNPKSVEMARKRIGQSFLVAKPKIIKA